MILSENVVTPAAPTAKPSFRETPAERALHQGG